MYEMQRLVNEFRTAMDLPISEAPRTLSPAEAELHIKMIRDEFEQEFVKFWMEQNLVEMYDAGIDLIVYILGAMSHAGFDVEPGFREIMRSNMSKMDPETGKPIKAGPNDPSGEPEGKVLKGPHYSPPNLTAILNDLHRFGPEDTTVYRVAGLPLTLGEGGPRIGNADVTMDHNGLMTIDAEVEDVDVLPMLGSVSLSDLSLYAEDIIDAEEVQDEPEPYSGPAMLAQPQADAPNYENRPVVNLEEAPVNPELHNLFTETRYESGTPSGVHIFPPYDR
ncbi:MazG-like pyrophosphohydrolase [Microbacterium phage Damascus]|nr:MazG-like pyrophosphohydrolase [Microbacterium phage Damascus]